MNPTDSPRQNELFDYLEGLPTLDRGIAPESSRNRRSRRARDAGAPTPIHPQNPLVPPARGSNREPDWWPHGVELLVGLGYRRDTSASDTFVTGDLSTLSAKLTAVLAPILLALLILVLVNDYFAPVAATKTDSPQPPALVAGAMIEAAPETLKPHLSESPPAAMLPTPQIRESQLEDEIPAPVENEVIFQETVAIEMKPAQPQDAEPAYKPEVVAVMGILYSRDNPSAIVGDRIVHVGDVVLDATVVGITRDRVIFEKPGQRWDRRVQEAVAMP